MYFHLFLFKILKVSVKSWRWQIKTSQILFIKKPLNAFLHFYTTPSNFVSTMCILSPQYRYMDCISTSLLRSIILKLKLSYKSFTSHYCYLRHTGSNIGRGARYPRVSQILWSCSFHGVWIFFSPLSMSVYFCILFNKKLPPFDQILRKVVLGNAKCWSNKLF